MSTSLADRRGALVTLVERKSLYTVIGAIWRNTAKAVRKAVVAGLTPHKNQVHTLTYDNGREFSDHEGNRGTYHLFLDSSLLSLPTLR